MWWAVCCVFIYSFQYVAGFNQCQANTTELSCTTEIAGENSTNYDFCKIQVYPQDSLECSAMKFESVPTEMHSNIGGVTLKPYIIPIVYNKDSIPLILEHTVMNISFTNIKWKSMKFRFQDKYKTTKNHCRNIVISNDFTVDNQSVLYYDCYWPKVDHKEGQSHILDFEATAEDLSIYRGQYYFNIPSPQMLSLTTTEEKWKPFIYVEILEDRLRVHITPPPPQLKIYGYFIKVITSCGKGKPCTITSHKKNLQKYTDEVTHDYKYIGVNGTVVFVVTPVHDNCLKEGDFGCESIESPFIMISNDSPVNTICIASVTALVVSTIFAYYVALRMIRKWCCKDKYSLTGMEIPAPPQILVVYSSANRLHAECVSSLVNYLRTEYGFPIMYDGDICNTTHGDPYEWAEQAFRIATHIMYVVGPAVEEVNLNIYDRPIISPLKDVDTLLLSFTKAERASKFPKKIVNVFFEHSNGTVPIEVTAPNASFKLLRDWQKLICYLSKDLIPNRQILRTENGKCFMEHLNNTEKLLGAKSHEKKILL